VGQKVNPISLRLGINQSWRSVWYADKKHFGDMLIADQKIRQHVRKQYRFAGIPRIDIERTGGEARVTLHCARPGVVIGRKGEEVDRLRGNLETLAGCAIHIDINEVSKPELDATLISQAIAEQLQKRSSFRRALKKAADTAMQMGAKGAKIEIAGRLGGSEMRRRERVVNGMIPLHTLDAYIDYGFTTCVTKSGTIGVKVWVYRGPQPPKARGADSPTDQDPAGGTD
jgi:small subunit ribosomal protein S3